MLRQVGEFGKWIEINGFRGIKIGDAKALAETIIKQMPQGVEVQLFNADLVAGWQHLYFAAINALSAFETKRNISKSLAVETALYASAHRQIKKAIDQIGLKTDSENAGVLVIGGDGDSVKLGFKEVSRLFDLNPDDTVLELSEIKILRIKSEFDVCDSELQTVSSRGNPDQALADIIIERVALLSTRL